MDESVWFKHIENEVLAQSEKLYKRDFKFFHVDTLLKVSKKIDLYAATCNECKELKISAELLSSNLLNHLKGDLSSRKEYEKKLDQMNIHLRKVHGIFPAQYYISLFSFIGLIIGIFSGISIMYLVDSNSLKEGFFVGGALGILVGRIYGKYRDNILRKEGKQLE